MTDEATPRPWIIEEQIRWPGGEWVDIRHEVGLFTVAPCVRRVDAALIVHAVNILPLHERVAEAAQRIREFREHHECDREECEALSLHLAFLDAALHFLKVARDAETI